MESPFKADGLKLQTGSSADRRVELNEGAHLCNGPARGAGGWPSGRAYFRWPRPVGGVTRESRFGLLWGLSETFPEVFFLSFFIQSRSRWWSDYKRRVERS